MKKLIALLAMLAVAALMPGGVFAQTEGVITTEGGAPGGAAQGETTEEADRVGEGGDEPLVWAGNKGFNWKSLFNMPIFNMDKADVTTGLERQHRIEFLALNAGVSNSWFGLDKLIDIANNSTVGDISSYLDKGELNIESGFSLLPALSVRIALEKFGIKVAAGATTSFYANGDEEMVESLKKLKSLIEDSKTSKGLISVWKLTEGLGNLIGNLIGTFSMKGEAYAFVDVREDMILLNKKLWLCFGPSFFTPLFYMPHCSAALTGKNSSPPKIISLTGPLEGDATYGFGGLGIDLTAEARYAIFPILDAGLELSHIPFLPAFADAKYELSGEVSAEINLALPEVMNLKFYDIDLTPSGGAELVILRPLRFDFYGIIKPFSSSFLTVRPNVGFSVKYPASEHSYMTFNTGIEATVNLPVILSATLGFNILEQVYSNYIRLGFNFGDFEFDLGAALRGTDISSSWTLKGVSGYVGVKF